MPSRRTVLCGAAGLLVPVAGCSLPAIPGEEPHPTREWLYDPNRFTDEWRRYRVVNRMPALWLDHRRWLGDATVDQALDARRSYYEPFGVRPREVDWRLRVGGVDGALPQLCVSASAFNRQRLERHVNATTAEHADDYRTMAMYRAPERDRAYAAGGDYLVDCRYGDPHDPCETLRTCIDTQTGAVDRFTAVSERSRRLADAVASEAEFAFDVFDAPVDGVVGHGWQRRFDRRTTRLRAVVLFEEDSTDEAAFRERVRWRERASADIVSLRVDGRLGVLTATRPTETVRLDVDPFAFA